MLLFKRTPGGRGMKDGTYYEWVGPDPVEVADHHADCLIDDEPGEFADTKNFDPSLVRAFQPDQPFPAPEV